MGGSIFVGVRTSDGVEHLGISWTNWLPELFTNPTFYSGGKALQELLDYWSSKDGRAEVRKRIGRSEYGAILCDLKTEGDEKPQIWHCNGYSDFGNLLYSAAMSNSISDDALALYLIKSKQYSRIDWDYFSNLGKPREPTKEELRLFVARVEAYVNAVVEAGNDVYKVWEREHGRPMLPTLVIHTTFADIQRVSENEPEKAIAESLNAWVKKRGWKSPVNKTWR